MRIIHDSVRLIVQHIALALLLPIHCFVFIFDSELELFVVAPRVDQTSVLCDICAVIGTQRQFTGLLVRLFNVFVINRLVWLGVEPLWKLLPNDVLLFSFTLASDVIVDVLKVVGVRRANRVLRAAVGARVILAHFPLFIGFLISE